LILPENEQTIISFLKLAVELAQKHSANGAGGPFGALVVKDGQIIGEGYNQVTSQNDPTAHAEIQAVRAACKKLNSFQLDDCVVYSSCEPCPMCLGALYWARPKAIYFASTREDAAAVGFDDDFIYKELILPLERRSIPTRRVETEGHDLVFKLWSQKTDRIDY
jgi:guanine deaminase